MRILITDGMAQHVIDALCNAGCEVVEHHCEADELAEALQAFDVVIVSAATEIRGIHIDEALEGELKLIICTETDLSNIDAGYAENLGIAVRSASDNELVPLIYAFFQIDQTKGDSVCQ